MFEHIGMLALSANTTDAQLSHIVAGLQNLPQQIDSLQSAHVTIDAGLSPGNAALMFTMAFRDRNGWELYRTHPEHLAVIRERIAPNLVTKLFIQIDRASPTGA